VKLLQGDIRNEEFLRQSCQGVGLVIHTAAIIDTVGKITRETLMAINVTGKEGQRTCWMPCVQGNVCYCIYTSSVEVILCLVYNSKLSFNYGQSKRLAEQRVLNANGRALKDGGTLFTCALRSMYIYGEGSQFLGAQLDQAIMNGGIFHRRSKKESLVNPVYVGNIAWAHVVAAQAMVDPGKAKKIAGNFYFISDDTPHLSYSDLNHTLGKEIGLGVQENLVLPFPVLYFLAFLLEGISFLLKPFVRFIPPFTRHLLLLLNTPFTFSYSKAQRDMGYKPRVSWEESKERTSEWMASQLLMRKEHLRKNKQC
ncbi:hypothetical protein GDO86_020144, partial [Hymenochirus boettgeri]